MLPSFGCKLRNDCPSFIMSLVAFGFNFKLKGYYVLAANCLMSAIKFSCIRLVLSFI